MRRLLLLLLALVGLSTAEPLLAQMAEPSPEQLRELADLLRDPAIQSWLESQASATPGEAAPAGDATAAAGGHQPMMAGEMMTGQMMAGRLDAVRTFLHELAAAAPTLPDEFAGAGARLLGELQERGPLGIVVLLAVFAGLGFGVEWLFWWATTGFRERMIASPLETANERLRALALRLLYGIGVLLAFAIGSVGAFLLFDWPPILKEIVLAYLFVFLIVRLVLVLGRILLAPGAERFRVVPMANEAAHFWFLWSAIIVGWFFFVRVTLDMLLRLGMRPPAVFLIGVTCGLALLGLALSVVWRHPGRDGSGASGRRYQASTWLLSCYLVVVWLLLFTGSAKPFYIGVVFLLLPIALLGTRLGVNHLLRPSGSEVEDSSMPSLTAVALERGLAALLIVSTAFLVASILDLDLAILTASDTMATRLARGVINAVIILLVADLAWHLARAWIDRKLALAKTEGEVEVAEARRRARLRTLLPIFRNVLYVVLMVMAFLMALSALGVEIGPLVAGAGVVGVAVGFGAQTLVKDIISGMFYLLDDAFRVGEYIISGSYKGTVESFSLRSVKLRHHRGYLYTVPFGELGAVQNMSRDWVIDKLSVSVTYDTDLDKVKKIIKEIGKELKADPEFAPNIIETLKMQGVEQFGDFAIQIRMKMMTKPGEQFVIRRKAYGMIKKAFAANGIEIALPTVTVSGGSESNAAAAQRGLELVQPPAAQSA